MPTRSPLDPPLDLRGLGGSLRVSVLQMIRLAENPDFLSLEKASCEISDFRFLFQNFLKKIADSFFHGLVQLSSYAKINRLY